MSEHPSHNEPQTPPQTAAAAAVRGVSQSRRKLLRAGAIGAPALVALKATPVMACNCKLPSGFSVSGNLSRAGSRNCASPGTKPSGWAGKCSTGTYAGTTISKSAKFSSLTGAGNRVFSTNLTYLDGTLDAILTRNDLDLQALIVAVYLEAIVSGGANYPTKEMVIDMWNQAIIGSTGYKPSTSNNTLWSKTDVTNYLLYLTGQAA